MTHLDDDRFQELLNLELDGALSPAQVAELDGYLSRGAEFASERRTMERLGGLLAASQVAVRPGFREEVMAGLPPAAWEVRREGGWRLASAVAALLVVAALGLVAVSGSSPINAGPTFGLVSAVGAFLQGSLVVGAGLLAASWTGAGLAVSSLFSNSVGTLLAFLALVIGLDAAFLILLFGRSRQHGTSAIEARSGNRPRS